MESLTYNIGGFIKLLTFNDILIVILSFVIIVLLLVIYYLIKEKNTITLEDDIIKETNNPTSTSKEVDELKALTKNIEDNYEPKTIRLTDYEEEQEENAIISYQELIKNTKGTDVNYVEENKNDEEYQNFEVKIRKIDLSDIPKRKEEVVKKEEPEFKVPMMKETLEGDFLLALKKLQKELNK